MNEVAGFDASQHGLVPLKVEVWEGHVMVNFDPQAKPLSQSLGDMTRLGAKVPNGGIIFAPAMRFTIFLATGKWRSRIISRVTIFRALTGIGRDMQTQSFWKLAESKGLYDLVIAEFDEP